MKSIFIFLTITVVIAKTAVAQTWTVGTPVNETIIDHPDSAAITVDTFCYSLNATNDQVAQYELALPPVSGINYYLVVDLTPTNPLDSFKFRQGTNVQILHLGDSMQLFPTFPIDTIHLSYAGSTGLVSVKFIAVGTPLTAGQNYPCGSTYDGWFEQPIQCMGRTIADPTTYLTNCVVQGFIGITDPSINVEALVYPNPFSTQLSFALSYNEPATLVLYDYLGQQVLQKSFTNSTTVNTEQLADGIYFYELRNDKGTLKTGKVVKQ
jgi:hypothetical protein